MPTHKKHHDKDRYYNLAKEQGYRSRAAFKLIQINKKFDFLSKAKVLIDLCAAPGGWSQVAAKTMPSGSIVLGVDLLPIRPIKHVKTIIGDITTAQTRRDIQKELQGWKADVVLCDGAPNVGAAYVKDAYVQNELALMALKTATDHLMPGGTFCTKVYRSQDYTALIWALQQLFEDVQVVKPPSSRTQSAETFVVCLRYLSPSHIDPRILDPAHVFKQVEDPSQKKLNVLHKRFDQHEKRHRGGYDDSLGMILHRTAHIDEFIESQDAVQMLTDYNELTFTGLNAEMYLNHKATTEEIKHCLKDLRVLGRTDFKMLLKWRLKLRKMKQDMNATKDDDEDTKEEEKIEKTDEEKEADVQRELAELRQKAIDKRAKLRKKERESQAKLRRRQALGMEHRAVDLPVEMDLFALSTIETPSHLQTVGDVDLDETVDPLGEYLDREEWSDDDMYNHERGSEEDSELDEILEHELNSTYNEYLSRKKRKGVVEDLAGTREEKRTKLRGTAEAQVMQNMLDDAALVADENDGGPSKKSKINSEVKQYVKMLEGQAEKESDSEPDSDEEGDPDDHSDGEDEDGEEAVLEEDELEQIQDIEHPLLVEEYVAPTARAERWFSNPIFGETLISENTLAEKQSLEEDKAAADELLASMPKTDKEVRKEKRKKAKEREERKRMKRMRLNDEDDRVEVVPISSNAIGSASTPLTQTEIERRDLIKRGMGSAVVEDSEGFEVVPAVEDHEVVRNYDSDHEEYTDEDRAMTLAMGVLMLRKSRAKTLVDASYNRFAWNDPKGLPEWFVDDESRHNKPQLPIPKALLEQMKQRFQSLATKPVKKVAEARARKQRRAVNKLKAAKKKATALSSNPDMSERQKLKAIQHTMKNVNKIDKPSKVYVVSRKTKGGVVKNSTGKGPGKVKMVDSRMKKDKRADKANKKRGGRKRT